MGCGGLTKLAKTGQFGYTLETKNMITLSCVDCQAPLVALEERCGACGRAYTRDHGILVLWPKEMPSLALEEAEHHDHDDGDATDVHQLNAPRNRFYHERLWRELLAQPAGSAFVEIGAGTGHDAAQFVGKYDLLLTDVSPHTLERTAKKLGHEHIQYAAAEGAHVPVGQASVDALYVVATFHHLPDPAAAVREYARVLKSGGVTVLAIEPNATYFRWIKYFRKFLCKLTHADPHEGSHADAEMEGFTYKQLHNYFPAAEWRDVRVEPMWLVAGWWHYVAEFLFRSLRLKKRIQLPEGLEMALVHLDELLFKIPGVKHLGWHWYVRATRV